MSSHRSISIVLFVIYSTISMSSFATQQSNQNNTLNKQIESVSKDWLSNAQQQIAKQEYYISKSSKGIQAVNRQHNLRSYFSKNGVSIEPRTDDLTKPMLTMQFGGMSRITSDKDNTSNSFSSAKIAKEIHFDKNQVTLTHDNGIEEWYINDEKGLEHGFNVKQRLEGQGELSFIINVAEASVVQNGKDIQVKLPDGGFLDYKKLVVLDNNQQLIAANMHKLSAQQIQITFDDSQAVYPLVVDPILSNTLDTQLEVNQADASFGASIASGGDINNDGYDDLIVGAPLYDNGTVDEGAVFIFHGSAAGLSTTPDALLENNIASTGFGESVVIAGDVNGDTYDDVVVGASRYSNGETKEGAVYVYYGGQLGITTTPAIILESNNSGPNNFGARFGEHIATGNINNDAWGDIIVAASSYSNGQNYEGAAFIYHGSSTGFSATPTLIIEGNQADGYFTYGLSSIGDVNNDGYDDVLVATDEYDLEVGGVLEIEADLAIIYYGSASGLNATQFTALMEGGSNASFGSDAASAGDVNGDGISDLIIGAARYSNGQNVEGAVFIYHGNVNGISTTYNSVIEGDVTSLYLGTEVSSAGDINKDGYSDIVLGSTYHTNGESYEGAIYIYYGSASGVDTTQVKSFESNNIHARFGGSITSGDVNGDGFSDVIASAAGYTNGESKEGAVFVYYGGFGDPLEGEQADAWFGQSVSSAGDVNNDGYDDVIIGAKNFDNGETDEGVAFVILGSATGLSSSVVSVLENNIAGSAFGSSVASAGDVNNDGYDDVIVGAEGYDMFGKNNVGAAYIFHGSASGINTSFATKMVGTSASAYFGGNVSSAGDVNNDGYDDVVIAAEYYSFSLYEAGAVYVYHGSASGINNSAALTIEGDEAEAHFGNSIASAGDVNNDGFADIIIGASYYDGLSSDSGIANIYHGSVTGINATPAIQLSVNQSSAQFGLSVSSAGDVNNDGYSDVVVASGVNTYIYHGSSNGISSNTPNLQITGGRAVASTGDVNSDGYSDIIVGDWSYGNGEAFEGHFSVYHGSISGIRSTVKQQVESNHAYARLGWDVASAGDINGDNISDFIVGAYHYSNGQNKEGKSFVYNGTARVYVDTDGDGVDDADDAFPNDATETLDSDWDGVGNNADAFPNDPTETLDTDTDGTGNNADTDDDNDGVLDSADAFPLDAAESVDTDGDGTGNNADTDDDNDGFLDVGDVFPLDVTEWADNDGDSAGNNSDPDDDNDGVLDGLDAFPFDATESVDTDGDGIGDNADAAPTVSNITASYSFNTDLNDTATNYHGTSIGGTSLTYAAQYGYQFGVFSTNSFAELPLTLSQNISTEGSFRADFTFRKASTNGVNNAVLFSLAQTAGAFWQAGGVSLLLSNNTLVLAYNDGVAPGNNAYHSLSTINVAQWNTVSLILDANLGVWKVIVNNQSFSGTIESNQSLSTLKAVLGANKVNIGGSAGIQPTGFDGSFELDNLKIYSPSPINASLIKNAFTAMKDHITGTTPLTNLELETHFKTISDNYQLNDLSTYQAELYSFTSAYETAYAPLYQDGVTHLFDNMPVLGRTLQLAQSHIFNTQYSASNVANMSGVIFEHSEVIPGAVSSNTVRVNNAIANVNGSYATDIAAEVHDQTFVVRPTGYYAAPGDLVTITIPASAASKGLSVITGVHFRDMDYSAIGAINRFPDISNEFSLTSTTIQVANPFGGGIYLKVPDGTSVGWFDMTITNAVKSPYFSYRSGKQTSVSDWLADVANTGAPWADFESDKFMFTIPVSYLVNVSNPDAIMARWDAILDSWNVIGGRPTTRARAEFYTLDTRLVTPAYGAGYPMVIPLSEASAVNGAGWNPLNVVTAPPHATLSHEMGHNQLHPTLTMGTPYDQCHAIEAETVNHTLALATNNLVYGMTIDDAFRSSYSGKVTSDEAAFDWIITNNFRNNLPMAYDNSVPMPDQDMLKYQFRGWAKYKDIAKLFGFATGIGKVNGEFYTAGQQQASFACPSRPYVVARDEYIKKASAALGVNMAPLFHFWGIVPSSATITELATNYPITTNPVATQKIADLIVYYKDSVAPKNITEYTTRHNQMYSKMGYQQPRYDEYITQFDSIFAQNIQNQFTHILTQYGLLDADSDGVIDAYDAFPTDPSESKDSDNDGVGDNADVFPNDATETVDTDGDGTGNNADTDDDNDGVSDSSDAFPLDATESVDTDGDGIGNNADTDDDNDGVLDINDQAPLNPSKYDLTNPVIVAPNSIAVAAVDVNGTSATESSISVFLASANGSDDVDTSVTVTNDAPSVFPLGVTTVTFSAVDAAGNTGSATAIVTVSDLSVPVITLVGNTSMTLNLHASFTEPGYSATDNIDGDITSNVVVTGVVNTVSVGTYTLSYAVVDTAGNIALIQTRQVTVQDASAPVIVAPNNITVAAVDANGTPATEAAIATFLSSANGSDDVDSNVVVAHNAPNVFPMGVTTVTFTATDAAGNTGSATAKVTVSDLSVPVITLVGNTSMTVNLNASFTDPGYIATDNVDGDITSKVVVTGTVNTASLGTYTLSYSVVDTAGNNALIAIRQVTVQDASAPVIVAPNNITVAAEDANGTPATEAAIATFLSSANGSDDVDSNVVVAHDAPNVFPMGVTTVTFTATDAAGNTGSATAIVTVSDLSVPVITLVGNTSMTLNLNASFTEPGYTATDNVDGDITSNVVVTGTVNTANVGTYTISYAVADSAGNSAVGQTRQVTVQDASAPVIVAPNNITVAAVDANGTPATESSISVFLASANGSDDVDTSVTITNDAPSNFPIGITTVTFSATDLAGNTGSATAIVTVSDQSVPVITLVGDTSIVLSLGGIYSELGYTANDNVDGDISGKVVITGMVDTSMAGTYSLSYNVTDNANNDAATQSRQVTIVKSNTHDSDGDGVIDTEDGFPFDATESVDTDGDGIGNNTDTDDDNDNVPDTSDGFPLDSAESIDTDGDGIGNNADSDDDNDGLLDEDDDDPLTPYVDTNAPEFGVLVQVIIEATGELTQVSLVVPVVIDDYDIAPVVESDVVESLALGIHQVLWTATDSTGNQSSATQEVVINDTTPPSFTLLEPLKINAQGRLTQISEFINAEAVDLVDGDVVITTLDDTQLTSGAHSLNMVAVDKAGNETHKTLEVSIYPAASLSSSLQVEAGGRYSQKLILSGNAPDYPVIVDYQVVHNSHVIDSLTRSISAGTQGQIEFSLPDNISASDELSLILSTVENAYVSSEHQTQLIVIENNTAPLLEVTLSQSGNQVGVIDPDNGVVTMTATINDVNQLDEHAIEWLVVDNEFIDERIDNDEFTLEFDPSTLTEGAYSVEITATERNTGDALSVVQISHFVVEQLITLDSKNDSDGDGISDSDEGYSDADGDGIVDYLDNDSNTTRLPTISGNEPMQTTAGLSMSLGTLVSMQGTSSNNAGLTLDRLAQFVDSNAADTEDNHFVLDRPLYNFVIDGLSQQGESVVVVIPLEEGAALPAGGVYRKYNTINGWYTFVEDAKNSVRSAKVDSNGNCPLAYDTSYEFGLSEGSNCIQLIIEDGGPNDADFIANGSVEDPGTIAFEMQNHAPVINLPTSYEIDEETKLTLDASNTSDAEGDDLIYSWLQLSGSPVMLSGTMGAQLAFTTPSVSVDELLIFELTVDDGRDSVTTTTTVSVRQVNKAPVVSIKSHAESAEENSTITLISQGSDADGDTLIYQWEQLSGPSITFDEVNTAQVSIDLPPVDIDEVVVMQITVSDGYVSSSSSTTFIVSNKVEVIVITPVKEKSKSGGSMAWLFVFILTLWLRKTALVRHAA